MMKRPPGRGALAPRHMDGRAKKRTASPRGDGAAKNKRRTASTVAERAAGSADVPPPAPAVQLQAVLPAGVDAAPSMPAPPVIPAGEAAARCDAAKTESLIRGCVAYNVAHAREIMRNNSTYFKNWGDRPVYERAPLAIRRRESPQDLLSTAAPWQRTEAMTAIESVGCYEAFGNVFWVKPFVDGMNPNLVAVAGDPPWFTAVSEASRQNFNPYNRVSPEGLRHGKATVSDARIRFPHKLTVFQYDKTRYDADHFEFSLPLVVGHVSLWAFHLALTKAIIRGDVDAVAVLIQAALCAPIEAVLVTDDRRLSEISADRRGASREAARLLSDSFPSFACLLEVVFGGATPTISEKVAYCEQQGIRFAGAVVNHHVVKAANACNEFLDGRARATLQKIARRGESGRAFCCAWRHLHQIIKACKRELGTTIEAQANLWGTGGTVQRLVTHVLDYVSWALDKDEVPAAGVSEPWLWGGSTRCGAVRTALAKMSLKIYVENLVHELPAESGEKKAFLDVLGPFRDYGVFGEAFRRNMKKKISADAPGPALDSKDDLDDGQWAAPTGEQGGEQQYDDDDEAEEVDPDYARMKARTPAFAQPLLDFFVDLFGDALSDPVGKFLCLVPPERLCQVDWGKCELAGLKAIRQVLNKHGRMTTTTVPAAECSVDDNNNIPVHTARALKRSLSQSMDADPHGGDVNARETQISQERVAAWSKAQAMRRQYATCDYSTSARMNVDALEDWWQKQTDAVAFEGAAGREHRVFVLSAERMLQLVESTNRPWQDPAPLSPVLEWAVDWMLQRRGPGDTIILFDGCSRQVRHMMEKKMRKARHATDLWIVYEPRLVPGGRRTVFGSKNRETAFVSFPASRNHLVVKDRVAGRGRTNEWETDTFASSFCGVLPMCWWQLPTIACGDKKTLLGGRDPKLPDGKVYDASRGCPLCWQEVKSKEFWMGILSATQASYVVDLAPGGGVTARACLALGIPWVGLCENKVHADWLGNVLDRWTLDLIVTEGCALYEQDLATLVRNHFSDALQQIQERDGETGPATDGEEELGDVFSAEE